jgi:hypothetical protein
MIKRIKPAFLLLIHILILQGIYGQTPSDMTGYLRKRFTQYCKSVPREEIFIHTDRQEYISGENIWFNIYLIDRQSFNQSNSSSIVYFELLNSQNRPVVQKRILITKGLGPGQILLPDTLSTGAYTIRAYTNWMKNFLPYNCFMKDILVYNAINTKPTKAIRTRVNNILSKESNDIHPDRNEEVNVRINNLKSDTLEMVLDSDKKFRDENNNNFYIFIQTHGNINYISSEKMTGNSTSISLPKRLLSQGINQITFFNSSGGPFYERYIYTPQSRSSLVSIKSADSCSLRDRVVLDIELQKGTASFADSSNLSISVSPLPGGESDDMNDYLLFGSEFEPIISRREFNEFSEDKIDSILLYVKSNWINWKEILSGELSQFKYKVENEDHFVMGDLVTNEGKSVTIPEYLLMCIPGKEAEFQYARTDNNGHFCFRIHIDEGLRDLIIMPDNGNKNRKIRIESSFTDKYKSRVAGADITDRTVPSFVSKLSVNHQVQKIYGISSVGPQQKTIHTPVVPVRFYGKPDFELILSDYINLPVMSEIIFELLPGVTLKKKKSGDEISITYHIGDNQFTTYPCLMIDGIIIKDVALIDNIDPEIVEKIDIVREKYFVGRYFFPGIINVITKAGDFSCISLPEYMIRMPYRVIDPVNSFVSPDYSKEQNRESRIPDYRNTLYWNPSVQTDKDGKARIEFWSSDNKAEYIINIQGITQDGKIFSGWKILRVR